MKALVTGGAGFIGSHLVEHLLAQGDEVVVLDNLSTGRFDNIRHLVGRPGFSYMIADVEDASALAEAGASCDAIFHLAAAAGVSLIMEDPVRTIETNVNGTEGVLRYAYRYGKRVLVASTSEVYGKGVRLPFNEEDDVVYGPTSKRRWAYAVSKAVDEFLVRAYAESKGLPGVVVRLFNTVGPRQVGRYGMVVPRFVKQAMTGGPITVHGDGSQTRCFEHVLDIVPALRKLILLPSLEGDVVNLGVSEQVSILALAERVRTLVDPAVPIRIIPYEEAYPTGFEDMKDRVPDLSRVHSLIGYEPTRTLDDILRDVHADLKGLWRSSFPDA